MPASLAAIASSSALWLLWLLWLGLLLLLLVRRMASDGASRRRAQDPVACHMARDAAYRRAFEAPLCLGCTAGHNGECQRGACNDRFHGSVLPCCGR
jgi:hypothetical protein